MNKLLKNDPRFKCPALFVEYNFDKKVGKIVTDEHSCVDMSGTIKFFEEIDQNVSLIETFSGNKADVSYIKLEGKWEVRSFTIPDGYGKVA